MGFAEILILALALAADAFAVGISVGLTWCRPRQVFRLSWHFGLFQALMPALGALGGTLLREIVQAWAPYVAAGLLTAVGVKMLIEANKPVSCRENADPTRGWSLIVLSIAVSIDAFAAGVVLAMLHAPLLLACLAIGAVASLATVAAMLNSRLLKRALGVWAERAGGIVLLALAIRALVG